MRAVTAVLLDGQALATQIKDDLAGQLDGSGLSPGLGTILVGDDPASHSYVGAKIRDCAEVAGWVTPRIGGAGRMTRAMLLANTVDAARSTAG